MAVGIKMYGVREAARESSLLAGERVMDYRQVPSTRAFLLLRRGPSASFYLRQDFVATTINYFKVRPDWEQLISLAALRYLHPLAPAKL